MKLFIAEYGLLQKERLKLILITVTLSFLGILISAKNGFINSDASSEQILLILFGSADSYPMNWIYWVSFLIGYVVLLQIVWKSRVNMFEIYQLLRYRNTNRFWIGKFALGFIFTCIYILSFLLTAWITSFLLGASMIFSLTWLLVLLFLTLNLYGHALLWLAMKIYWRVEGANIILVVLIYMGIKLPHPFFPLYYGMIEKIKLSLSATLFIESAVLYLLFLIILRKAKTMDYIP